LFTAVKLEEHNYGAIQIMKYSIVHNVREV
jgi:hypothetical protein